VAAQPFPADDFGDGVGPAVQRETGGDGGRAVTGAQRPPLLGLAERPSDVTALAVTRAARRRDLSGREKASPERGVASWEAEK